MKISKHLNIFKVLITISLILVSLITFVNSYKRFQMKSEIENITHYMIDNYQKKDIISYTSFDDGGYLEYMGIKTYIDARAELFFEKYNKKSNIFEEYINVNNNTSEEYFEIFSNKYKFTHIIVNYDSNYERYLRNNDNYINEYVEYYDIKSNIPKYILYVRKDISVDEKA